MKTTATNPVAYFDRLTSGQFAGFPALALTQTASRFGISREQLRAEILAQREAEATQQKAAK